MFQFVFFIDKLSHYKTYDFRKFLNLDASELVRWQNTFSRYKTQQISHLRVDYACFLVKCINYQNVMCVQKVFSCKILQHSCDRAQFLARTLEESCKIFLFVIEHSFLQESCKNAIASKNLARIELFCQNLARSCKK